MGFVVDRCSWTLRPWNRSLAGVDSSRKRRRGHWATLPSSAELPATALRQQLRGQDQERRLRRFRGIAPRWRASRLKMAIKWSGGVHAWHHGPTWARGNLTRMSWPERDNIAVVCTTIESVCLSCSSIVNTAVFVCWKCIDDDEKHVY